MTDRVLEAAKKLIGDSLSELLASVRGLPVEALNWQPEPRANSIGILAAHSLGATHLWLRMAVGQPLPDRDREAEFRTSTSSAEDFMRSLEEMAGGCLATLDSVDTVDWSEMRETRGRGGDAPPEVPAAYAILHVTEHLRGHVDQVSLIRQLWEARENRP